MSSSHTNEVVEDILQCSVCMESYEESGLRAPKMLPCQHSFCVECLNNIYGGERLQCPICRKKFSTSVDKLPKSLLLIQLLDGRKTPTPQRRVEVATKDSSSITAKLREKYRDSSKASKYLTKLFDKIKNENQSDVEDMKAVLKCIQHHRLPNKTCYAIQVTSTSCMIHLISNDQELLATVRLLSEIAVEVIKTIAVFKDDKRGNGLLCNCLSILSNYKIASCAKFDCLHLSLLLMDILSKNDDKVIVENVTNVLSLTKGKLDDHTVLWTRENLKVLYNIIRKKLNSSRFDQAFINTLALLVNLTDESPSICKNVVAENGVPLCAELLKCEDPNNSFRSRCLAFLGNLALVPELQHDILDDNADLIQLLREMMNSVPRVRYGAALVLTPLLTVGFKKWEKLTNSPGLRREILTDLYNFVLKWEFTSPYLRFKTLTHFYDLLQRYDEPPLQLFAIWTIRNFCNVEPFKYKQMLIKEEGIDYLLELDENPYVDKNVKELAKETLNSIY